MIKKIGRKIDPRNVTRIAMLVVLVAGASMIFYSGFFIYSTLNDVSTAKLGIQVGPLKVPTVDTALLEKLLEEEYFKRSDERKLATPPINPFMRTSASAPEPEPPQASPPETGPAAETPQP